MRKSRQCFFHLLVVSRFPGVHMQWQLPRPHHVIMFCQSPSVILCLLFPGYASCFFLTFLRVAAGPAQTKAPDISAAISSAPKGPGRYRPSQLWRGFARFPSFNFHFAFSVSTKGAPLKADLKRRMSKAAELLCCKMASGRTAQ